MTAYEMMLSESQERMLMVLRPDRTELARKIFEKWELDFAIIGHLTETGHIVIKHKGQLEADIPLEPLARLRSMIALPSRQQSRKNWGVFTHLSRSTPCCSSLWPRPTWPPAHGCGTSMTVR